MEADERDYNYYPETITQIMKDHNLLRPEDEETFVQFVRGY
jgi:hypothetical protein